MPATPYPYPRTFPGPWSALCHWWAGVSPCGPLALAGGLILGGLVTAAPMLAQPTAAEPRITDFQLTLEDQQALASFRLAGAVDQRFLERVESGLPTAFVYRFELIRARRGWFDKTVDTNTLQVITMYDAIERRYLVNFKLAGKLVRSETVRDRPELEAAMTRFRKQPVFTLATLPDDWRLRIRLRGELGARTLFSLIPARVTTPWVESRRFRPTEARP